MNDFPKRYLLKLSTDQTTPKRSNSLTLHSLSLLLRKRDANAIVCESAAERCSNAAHKPKRDASHLTRVSKFRLICVFPVVFAT